MEEDKLGELLDVYEDAPLDFISKENLAEKFMRWVEGRHKEMIGT